MEERKMFYRPSRYNYLLFNKNGELLIYNSLEYKFLKLHSKKANKVCDLLKREKFTEKDCDKE